MNNEIYQIVADVVKNAQREDKDGGFKTPQEAIFYIAGKMADYFKVMDDNFDREDFANNCILDKQYE